MKNAIGYNSDYIDDLGSLNPLKLLKFSLF